MKARHLALLLSPLVALTIAACGGGESNPFAVKSEVVTPANNAAALAFAPDGRLFFAERLSGTIRVVSAEGQIIPQPFAQVNVALYIEWGLTGLALDPDFETNHYVYAFYTERVSEGPPPIARPVVVRFTEQNNVGVDPQVIVADLPTTPPEHPGFNANGRIHFGPDGMLYLSVGDYDVGDMAGDRSVPMGKLLRVDPRDGSAPPDNPLAAEPDADPRIFAYGFREPFDFAFHPASGAIYGTDNTPVTCEELNIVEAGENYGWPDVGEFPFSDCAAGTGKDGIHFFAKQGTQPGHFLSLVVVSSVAFVSGNKYPLIGDSILACELETKRLRRVILGGPAQDQVVADDVVVKDCQLAVAVSPDGTIYYSNDREIRRLVPVAGGT